MKKGSATVSMVSPSISLVCFLLCQSLWFTEVVGFIRSSASFYARPIKVAVRPNLWLQSCSSVSDNSDISHQIVDGDHHFRDEVVGRKERHTETLSRRNLLASALGATTSILSIDNDSYSSNAAITDETENYAVLLDKDDPYKGYQNSPPPATIQQSQAPVSDEIIVKVPKQDIISSGGLGIELGQVDFRTNTRVYIKSISPDSIASRFGIKKDWIVVSVNGDSTERTNAEGIAIMLSRAMKGTSGDSSIELRFRNPAIFQNKLNNLSSISGEGGGGGGVTTQVAPAGDTTQRNTDGSVKPGNVVRSQNDQRLTVSQLIPPKLCNRGATTDDLLEISYLGIVLDTGAVFDGSAIKINGEAIPGRANDVSLFFVLGKQPFGQFPPGWDVGLEGMCVGERRRLIIPPVLAYGSTGVPRRGIPPNATLQYDITLVSINGLATPQ